MSRIIHDDLLIKLVNADLGIGTHNPLVATRAKLTGSGHARGNNLARFTTCLFQQGTSTDLQHFNDQINAIHHWPQNFGRKLVPDYKHALDRQDNHSDRDSSPQQAETAPDR